MSEAEQRIRKLVEHIYDEGYFDGMRLGGKDGDTLDQATKAIRDEILDARVHEREEVALDNYNGHTFSESTDYKGKFQKFIRNNQRRIKQLKSKKEERDE